jgi:Catalase/Prokaryotic membrane lipoprotein lipid attachment site
MKKILFPALLLTLLSSCQDKPLTRGKASFYQLPSPELGEEWSGVQEAEAESILAITRDLISQRAPKDGLFSRDAHPKAHGCVKSFLEVTPEKLPSAQRVGIFSQAKKYESWIRFSNGDTNSRYREDLEADVRGMALKVMNVPEAKAGSQDFLMITSKEFFSKDGDEYLKLFHALTGGKAAIAWFALTHPLSAKRLIDARVKIPSPLETSYFSSVPYKLGNRSMRFKAMPCEATNTPLPSTASKNYLGETLARSLSQKGACFKMFVQPNMEPQSNPVEDPRQIWAEDKSPYYQVATITIPQQSEVGSRSSMNFCENLSMDPWHSLPQQRPLGQINRMRALIYGEISKMRHEQNRAPVMEPVNHTPCVGVTAGLCGDPRH